MRARSKLRVHFRRQREMAIGPDLSHRNTQVETLLAASAVRQAITSAGDDRPLAVSPNGTVLNRVGRTLNIIARHCGHCEPLT